MAMAMANSDLASRSSHSSIHTTPPLSSSSSDSSSFDTSPSHVSKSLHNLSSSIEGLISLHPTVPDTFSDVTIYASGKAVHLHRCILAARSPFFRALFSKDRRDLSYLSPSQTSTKDDLSVIRLDLEKILKMVIKETGSRIGTRIRFDAFWATMLFLYSGKVSIQTVKCIDTDCLHEVCLPSVKFAVEMLCLSSVFEIHELKSLFQNHLYVIVEKTPVEQVFLILIAAHVHGAQSLFTLCIKSIAVSHVSKVDLLKQLPVALAEEVISLRSKMNLHNMQQEITNLEHEMECQRIRKALDSDDVELVRLLLREGDVSIDEAYGLHYAVAYCAANTVLELLEIGIANPNLRNDCGFTVLHVAAIRREPSILACLLIKGANPMERTPNSQTARQLCARSIQRSDHPNHIDCGEELQKDRLSIEILDQAGRENPFANTVFPPAVDEKELFMRLLYLENRVAVGRLLFPQEAKLITGIVHLEATSEFTGRAMTEISGTNKSEGVDLNQMPPGYLDQTGSSLPIPKMNDALMKRVQALQKTVELGKRIFPCCSAILNSFMDDDSFELSLTQMGNPEEQRMKKRRFCELKSILEDAFRKDVEAMERHR